MPEQTVDVSTPYKIKEEVWDWIKDDLRETLIEFAVMLQADSDEEAKNLLLLVRKGIDEWIFERHAERGRDFYDER